MKRTTIIALSLILFAGCQQATNDASDQGEGRQAAADALLNPSPPAVPAGLPPTYKEGGVTQDLAKQRSQPSPSRSSARAATSGSNPARTFYLTMHEFSRVLTTVADGPSACAAAPRLTELAREIRPQIRPAYLWLATASDTQTMALMQEIAAQAQKETTKPPLSESEAIELAREPGNEPFRKALVAFYQALADECPTVPAAKAMEKLNRLRK